MTSTSSTPSPRVGSVLTVVAITALIAAIVLTVAAIFAPGNEGAAVTLDPAPATSPVTPSTVAPLEQPVAVPTQIPDADAVASDAMSPPTSSPAASQMGGRSSAIPPVIEPRPRPASVQISSMDVSGFPVRAVGLAPDGQLEIPDETEIGWYQYGSTPGRSGATVLAAHVSWNRTTGPFARLGNVEPGDQIEIRSDDGSLRRYEVTERALYGKLELPRDRIWRTTGDETLVLITCGGDFNPEIRRYRQNIVVFAVPIG